MQRNELPPTFRHSYTAEESIQEPERLHRIASVAAAHIYLLATTDLRKYEGRPKESFPFPNLWEHHADLSLANGNRLRVKTIRTTWKNPEYMVMREVNPVTRKLIRGWTIGFTPETEGNSVLPLHWYTAYGPDQFTQNHDGITINDIVMQTLDEPSSLVALQAAQGTHTLNILLRNSAAGKEDSAIFGSIKRIQFGIPQHRKAPPDYEHSYDQAIEEIEINEGFKEDSRFIISPVTGKMSLVSVQKDNKDLIISAEGSHSSNPRLAHRESIRIANGTINPVFFLGPLTTAAKTLTSALQGM